MPTTCTTMRWRKVLLAASALVSCGLLGMSSLRAQGLDMDTKSSAPTPAANQSGGLDMDVNPNAPIPPKPAAQALPRDNVQDGIAPLNAKTTQDAPLVPGAVPVNTPVEPAPAVAPPPPPVEPIKLDHPKVIDTAKLQSGDTTVSLYGIEGIAGTSAQGLQGFIGSGTGQVTCQAQGGTGFVCLMPDGTNVAQVALVNGAAKTTADAPDAYREQEAAAQAARRGIWANLPPPPETLKHPIVQDTGTLFAEGKTYVLTGVTGFEAPYTVQLQSYIATNGDSVTCDPQNDLGVYICLLPDGTDVAKVALVNGAARVASDAPDAYRVQQLDALNNRRGYWATAPEAVLAAAMLPPEPQTQYILAAGDDGSDGITYIGGAPVAMVDGESVFLVYGDDDLGWGYYDHFHHWHGAPDRFRHHMDRFHPGGHGLRGHDSFYHDAATRNHFEAMRRDPAMRARESMLHPGGIHTAMAAHPGMPLGHPGMGGRPGMGGPMGRAAMGGPMGHPGMSGPMGGRPGMGGPMGRPGPMAMGGRPGGGFMRPGPMASAGGFHPAMGGGFHPAAAQMHTAAAAPRGGGGGGRHR
jgi:endonuclease YncB( thermonuclease family)